MILMVYSMDKNVCGETVFPTNMHAYTLSLILTHTPVSHMRRLSLYRAREVDNMTSDVCLL